MDNADSACESYQLCPISELYMMLPGPFLQMTNNEI